MDPRRQLDRALDDLEKSRESGDISQEDYIRESNEMERDYRAEAEEAAERARQDELDRW